MNYDGMRRLLLYIRAMAPLKASGLGALSATEIIREANTGLLSGATEITWND